MTETKPRHARAYVRDLPGLSRDEQIAQCRDAAKSLGLRRVTPYGPHQLDEFVGGLRPDEVAIVCELIVIDESAHLPNRRGVGRRFERRVRDIERACLFVLDIAAGLRSTDEAWSEHVEQAHRFVTSARELATKKAVEMAEKRKRVAPGVATSLQHRRRAADRRRIRIMWTSAEFANAGEAIEAIGEEFPDLAGASRSTLERATGVGRNGKPKTKPK